MAEGGLRLESASLLIEAESCDLRIEDETGALGDVELKLKDGGSVFGGRSVRKLSGRRFALEGAFFTTCAMDTGHEPDWSLTGENVEVEVDGYGRIRNAAFRIRGVPVLYTPYLVFPAITRRQTGILLPRVGASDERGLIYEQPYFWAIDKHQDLTATGQVETAQRLGLGLEYRYRPSAGVAGEIGLQYYNEAIRGDSGTEVESPLFQPAPGEDIPANRAVFSASHRQRLEQGLKVYADSLVVSDDLVLRETDSLQSGFALHSARRTRRYTETRLGLLASQQTRDFGFVSYGLRGAYFQDLVGPDRYTLQEPGRLWTTGDGDLPFGLAYVVDGELAAFHRTDGADGQRINLSATIERPLLAGTSPLRAWTWARGRVTGYDMDDRTLRDVAPPNPPDDTEVGEALRRLDNYAGRALAEAGVDVRAGFRRTYAFEAAGSGEEAPDTAREEERIEDENLPLAGDDEIVESALEAGTLGEVLESEPGIWGAGGIRRRFAALHHTLEPFAGLRLTSDSQDDDLPLYDVTDRIDGRTTTTYGIASRFLFTEADGGRTSELARLSLAQTYNVDDKVIEDHFSDVDTTVAIRPTRDVWFAGLASYNLGIGSLRGAAATLSLERFALPFTDVARSHINAAYRFVRRGAVETAEEGLETLEARTILAFTKRFAIGLNGRYDFVSGEFVESGGGFRIESDCRCWIIDIGVTNRVNPDETQFRLQVDLGGIGSIGSSALRYRTTGLESFDYGTARARRYGW